MKPTMTTMFVLAGLALVPAPVAHAGSCGGHGGGGHGGGGGGGHGGGSSSSSSSSSSSTGTPACVDTTDIVGYRLCTKYGTWSQNLVIPTIIAEIGMTVRSFTNPLREGNGSVTHGDESFTYRVTGGGNQPAKPQHDTAVVATFRLGAGLPHGFYVAVEAELGGVAGVESDAAMLEKGARGTTPTLDRTSVSTVGAAGVFGLRGRTGHLDLAAEVAGGGRSVIYSYASTYGACEQTTSVNAQQGMAEARARAGYWFSPFGMIGVTAGKSLVDDSWMSGVYLSGQSRAFGGR